MRLPRPGRPPARLLRRTRRPRPVEPGAFLHSEERSRLVDAPPEAVWRAITAIGGEHGSYRFGGPWVLRGAVDRLAGGVGLRRGRPDRLRVGDRLDFWRVEELRSGELLRLRAEMRMPGVAWLELRVGTDDRGRTVYRQRTVFRPHGLPGHLYWWAELPAHGLVFGRLATAIATAAQSQQDMPKHAPNA